MPGDLTHLIQSIGYLGIWGIIFAETGLLVGFFLPGDSLLFTAGFLASQQVLNPWILIVGACISAIAGDSVGYYTGHRPGRRLFVRNDSFLFHKDQLVKAQRFYEKHGKKTIILARFLPIIRTFAPIVAGIGNMHYPTFAIYNIVGGLIWTVGLILAGFFLGRIIPDVDHYLLPIILLIIAISMLPTLWHLYQERPRHRKS